MVIIYDLGTILWI